MRNIRFRARHVAPFVFAIVGMSFGFSSGVRARTYRLFSAGLFEQDYSKTRSRITTRESRGRYTTEFDFADIARADQVLGCPLQLGAKDLRSAITDLVRRVDEIVKQNQDHSNPACNSLSNRLNMSRDDLLNRINVAYTATAQELDEKQLRINEASRQASAVSSFVATTSDLVEGRCLTKNGSKANIQRLTGQMITLGGLIFGGWPGMAAAGAGNILGRLPIFKSDIEQARTAVNHYYSTNTRADFLCHYREMQKMSCLIFSAPRSDVIYGNDLEFRAEPTKSARDNAEALQKRDPGLYREIEFLHRAASKREAFQTVEDVVSVCDAFDDSLFRGVAEAPHPDGVLKTYERHRQACRVLNGYDDTQPAADVIAEAKRNFRIFGRYFDRLKAGTGAASVTEAVATFISRQYFAEMVDKLRAVRDPSAANLDRVEYGKLVNQLGKKNEYATKSFDEIERDARKNLESSTSGGVASVEIRATGLRAWLDLCQTGDPTLVCLYPGAPRDSAYFDTWKESCVGPESRLCRTARKEGVEKLLEKSPKHQVYFGSLCGVKSG